MLTRILIVIAIISSALGCFVTKNEIAGSYETSCILYSEPSLIMELKSNGEFIYNMALSDDIIVGTWNRHDDTLRLVSEFFTNEYRLRMYPNVPLELTPSFKFTDIPEMDLYIIDGKKIFPLKIDRSKGTCPLTRKKL